MQMHAAISPRQIPHSLPHRQPCSPNLVRVLLIVLDHVPPGRQVILLLLLVLGVLREERRASVCGRAGRRLEYSAMGAAVQRNDSPPPQGKVTESVRTL